MRPKLETCTSILDLMMKSKNYKVFGVCKGSFLASLVGEGHDFIVSLKGVYEKSLRNPDLDWSYIYTNIKFKFNNKN